MAGGDSGGGCERFGGGNVRVTFHEFTMLNKRMKARGGGGRRKSESGG